MLRRLTLIAAVLPLLAACDDSIGPSGTSRLSIMLTDAPGDFVSAVVTIDEIYLQGGDASESPGRVYLSETPVTTDLLTLANDAMSLVDDAVVGSGHYADLRFVISGGYIEVENEDGSTSIYATQGYDHLPEGRSADGLLTMPSYGESGLKVGFDGTLDITGEQEILMVDFDVAQSYGRGAGNSGSWVMNPVIKGAYADVTSSLTVTLALGTDVTLPSVADVQVVLGDFKAVLSDGEGDAKEATFAEVDDVFTATFPYLMPGTTWSLDIAGPTGVTFTTDPALPMDVTATSGQDGKVELTLTDAAAS